MRERNVVVGQRQQIVEETRRRGWTRRDAQRTTPADRASIEALQTRRCSRSSARGAADGQADAVDRQRIVRANPLQQVMRRAAGTHVVLGVDLEEIDAAGTRQNVLGMFGLEAGTGEAPAMAANATMTDGSRPWTSSH